MDRITLGKDEAPLQDSAITRGAGPVVHVVGFSGSVSEGAAAIKAPVFEITGRFFSGDPDAPPSTTYAREQIEEFRQRGLLTLVGEKRLRIPGYIFLYAEDSFLRPSSGAFDLMPFRDTLRREEGAGAYCDYMPRDRAMALLAKWAERLVNDAKKSYREEKFLRSKESAMRARFAATREVPNLEMRREAHLYVAAARLALGESMDGVIWNVATEFSEEDAKALEKRAHGLRLRPPAPTRPEVSPPHGRSDDRLPYLFAA